jgi:hypothetical protein
MAVLSSSSPYVSSKSEGEGRHQGIDPHRLLFMAVDGKLTAFIKLWRWYTGLP